MTSLHRGEANARQTCVSVICDFVEENWPSMDFVGEATVDSLREHQASRFLPARVCPPLVRRFGRAGDAGRAHNTDRLANRFWDYPRALKKLDMRTGLFHVVDHSYGQLVHALPAARAVVTCHDVDTFRCLTHPVDEGRSPFFRLMTRRTLAGFRKAARVCCDSDTTRRSLIDEDLMAEDRLRTVLLPVHPAFSPKPDRVADQAAEALLAGPDTIDLLHVGSTVPRKRIDVLLNVLARLRVRLPQIRLVRVGGSFSPAQDALVDRLGVRQQIVCLPPLERQVLAAVYRRSAVVVLTSEREGFGLPLVEAIASGTPVVVTDLPIMREVGAEAASYCAIDDLDTWVERIVTLLNERESDPTAWDARRSAGLARAQSFTYATYASELASVYSELL